MDRRASGMGGAITPRRRSPICLALLIALAALLPAGAAASGGPARAWLTTGDRVSLLAEQSPDALGAPAPDAPTIAIDPAVSFQRIEGLGGSITDSSAHLLARSPDSDAIMRSLFDPRQGLGRSYLRQPIGASDFVAGPHYTYDDVGPGETDFGLRHFSIAHDRALRSCRCCARRAR
jgi:glucosylceramidase